jgi:tRNA 2-selenouridine synthase
VLDLEQLACHRGSLLGDLPGQPQPTQKRFDSAVLEALRSFDPERPVWLEAESKKIGALQIPEALFEAMRRAPIVTLSAPMAERVRLWREDYPHFAAAPVAMVERLEPLKPLVGKEILGHWHALAAAGQTDALFESIMSAHYDPCYVRSNQRNHAVPAAASTLELASLGAAALAEAVPRLVTAAEGLDRR